MKTLPVAFLFVLTLAACSTTSPLPLDSNVPPQYATIPDLSADKTIQPPKAIKRVEPLAPPSFIGSGRTVVAGIGVLVGEDGLVKDVWYSSGDAEWARAASTAVRQWTFQPAMKDGSAVAVRMTINLTFRSTGSGHF